MLTKNQIESMAGRIEFSVVKENLQGRPHNCYSERHGKL
jgi:hypothetical protein